MKQAILSYEILPGDFNEYVLPSSSAHNYNPKAKTSFSMHTYSICTKSDLARLCQCKRPIRATSLGFAVLSTVISCAIVRWTNKQCLFRQRTETILLVWHL